jgi:hypothetical protein
MPSIFDVYKQFSEKICSLTVIRLHSGDRKEMEEQTGNNWDKIVTSKESPPGLGFVLYTSDKHRKLAACNIPEETRGANFPC